MQIAPLETHSQRLGRLEEVSREQPDGPWRWLLCPADGFCCWAPPTTLLPPAPIHLHVLGHTLNISRAFESVLLPNRYTVLGPPHSMCPHCLSLSMISSLLSPCFLSLRESWFSTYLHLVASSIFKIICEMPHLRSPGSTLEYSVLA